MYSFNGDYAKDSQVWLLQLIHLQVKKLQTIDPGEIKMKVPFSRNSTHRCTAYSPIQPKGLLLLDWHGENNATTIVFNVKGPSDTKKQNAIHKSIKEADH